MGIFSNEEEEREKRRAAEANEQAEWHKRRAAEAKTRIREAELKHQQEIQDKRDTKEKKADIKAIANSGRGDAILDLLHEYEKHGDLYNAKTLINAWQIPHDKENFLLFAQIFNINYDYFKKMDKEENKLLLPGLRMTLLDKAKRVAQVYLKGQADEALELLSDVEQRLQQERKKMLNIIKWYLIGVGAFIAIMILIGTCAEN